jgi:hypothetical protein
MADLGPPRHDRSVEHRRREPLHRSADLRVRRCRHRASGSLSVHRHHSDLLSGRGHRRVHCSRAGSGPDRTHPGGPHRSPLRGGARDHAGHRTNRRTGEPGPLSFIPSHCAQGCGGAGDDPGAGGDGRRHGDRLRLVLHAAGASHHQRGLQLRRSDLLARPGRLLLGDQGLLFRRLHYGDLLLHGIQHPAGRRGGGPLHHGRRREQLGAHLAARCRAHQLLLNQ